MSVPGLPRVAGVGVQVPGILVRSTLWPLPVGKLLRGLLPFAYQLAEVAASLGVSRSPHQAPDPQVAGDSWCLLAGSQRRHHRCLPVEELSHPCSLYSPCSHGLQAS